MDYGLGSTIEVLIDMKPYLSKGDKKVVLNEYPMHVRIMGEQNAAVTLAKESQCKLVESNYETW